MKAGNQLLVDCRNREEVKHLIVFQHGMNGTPADFTNLLRVLRDRLSEVWCPPSAITRLPCHHTLHQLSEVWYPPSASTRPPTHPPTSPNPTLSSDPPDLILDCT